LFANHTDHRRHASAGVVSHIQSGSNLHHRNYPFTQLLSC